MHDNYPDSAPHSIIYTTGVQEVIASMKLHAWRRLWSWQTLTSLVLVSATFAVAVASLGLPWPIIVISSLGALLGGFFLPRAALWWYIPVAARGMFRNQPRLREEHTVSWDAGGLRSKSANTDESLPWTQCRRWDDNAQVLLLYQTDKSFIVIPKRVLSRDDVSSLRAAAASVGVRGA